MFTKVLRNPGPRPPFYELTSHVFGQDHDLDTDGDSWPRESVSWTELYVDSRENKLLRLVIEPAQVDPLVLRISASTSALLNAAAEYLLRQSGGELSDD